MNAIASDPARLGAMAFVIFFAIGLHEYAHCKFADMAGDPTPRIYGRVSLNLTKHFELYGTLMMIVTMASGYGIGWGKPAPMDPKRMRDPRWDFFAAVAAGPVSNLLQALVYGFLAKLLIATGQISTDTILFAAAGRLSDPIALVLYFGVSSNLALALFNLFPLGPLDGHWLLGLLLPERPRDRWFLFNRQYGTYLLLGLVLIGQFNPKLSVLSAVIGPILSPLRKILLGF